MEKRTVGIIGLVVTILLCGLPGLCGLCAGPIYILAGLTGGEIDIFGSSDPAAAIGYGVGTLCLSVIFVAIPVVIGFMTLRNKNEQDFEAQDDFGMPEDDF